MPEKTVRRKTYHDAHLTTEEVFRVLEQDRKAFTPARSVTVPALLEAMARAGNLEALPSAGTLGTLLDHLWAEGCRPAESGPPSSQFPWVLECVIQTTHRGRTTYLPYAKWEQASGGKKLNKPKRYYLRNVLTAAEWKLLADMVQVYPYISAAQSKKYLDVLNRMYHQTVLCLDDCRYAFRRDGTLDFALLDRLDDAIARQECVRIEYGAYRLAGQAGRWTPVLTAQSTFEIAPYALVWSNGYYYLVGARGRMGLVNLRADRMLSVEPTGQPAPRPASFDPARYRDSSPVMYAGTPEPVTLRFDERMLNVVLDFFGPAARFTRLPDGQVCAHVSAVPTGVELFAKQYAGAVEVTAPQALRTRIRQALAQAAAAYQTESAHPAAAPETTEKEDEPIEPS